MDEFLKSTRQLIDAHRAYVKKSEQREIDRDESRRELERFLDGGDLAAIDEDQRPRIVLVAPGFKTGVTATVLWLRRAYGMDISCVQLVPYEIASELLIGSSILIPLPESADYEVKVAEKLKAASSKKGTALPLDAVAAKAFIASIPDSRWASYGDVAAAGGSPKGAMGVGSWLANKGDDVPHVYRVLNASGQVSDGWKAAGPGLPPDPEGVQALLEREGVRFDDAGKAHQDQRWTASDWAESQPSE